MSSERRFWPPPLAPRTALPVCVRVRVSSGYAECGKGLPYFSEESDPIEIVSPSRSGASVRDCVWLWAPDPCGKNLAPFGRRDPSLHGYTYGYRHTGTHAMIRFGHGCRKKRGNMAETFKCCNVYNIYVLVVVARATHRTYRTTVAPLLPHPPSSGPQGCAAGQHDSRRELLLRSAPRSSRATVLPSPQLYTTSSAPRAEPRPLTSRLPRRLPSRAASHHRCCRHR